MLSAAIFVINVCDKERPVCVISTFRYIRLYGLKFSKEDHLALIHLLYELCVMPDLEVSLVQKFANQLIELLK